MCINHNLFGAIDERPFHSTDPQIGDVCEVLEIVEHYTLSGYVTCLSLEGYEDVLYDARNFAPLSDIDETTLVNERLKETV